MMAVRGNFTQIFRKKQRLHPLIQVQIRHVVREATEFSGLSPTNWFLPMTIINS